MKSYTEQRLVEEETNLTQTHGLRIAAGNIQADWDAEVGAAAAEDAEEHAGGCPNRYLWVLALFLEAFRPLLALSPPSLAPGRSIRYRVVAEALLATRTH